MVIQDDYRAYLSRPHFGDLDGLRFICIAMVLWHHSNPLQHGGLQLAMRGFMGVDFFFVLSGFLITTLLLREIRRTGTFSLAQFYRRRALRILPPYYLLVTAVCVYYVLIKGQSQLAPLVPAYYLFLSNFLTDHVSLLGITWSLSVEEQYYAIWPLLLALLPRRAVVPVLLLLIGLNVAVGLGLVPVDRVSIPPLLLHMPTATYAPILMGSLAALMLDRPGGYAALSGLVGRPGAATLLLVLLLACLQLTPQDVNGWPNLLLHSLMTLTLVSLVVRPRTELSGFLRWRPVARVGQVSYGIYLYHLIGLHVTLAVLSRLGMGNGWLVLILYSAVSWAIAEVSFRFYERRFLALRRRPPEVVG